jgi:hypothetical protein
LELLKNGLMTLPGVTNAHFVEVLNRATREYLESLSLMFQEFTRTVTTSFTLSNADNGYIYSSEQTVLHLLL